MTPVTPKTVSSWASRGPSVNMSWCSCIIEWNATGCTRPNRYTFYFDVPSGYVKLPTGEVARDPDEQVQSTVQLVFDKFDELGSCRRLHRHLMRNQVPLKGSVPTADHGAVGWNGAYPVRTR